MLSFLAALSSINLWMIFLAENLLVTALALLFGWLILKISKKPIKPASRNEVLICLLTNVINTVITYAGFWLFKHGYLQLTFEINWAIIFDFILLFLLMDLAMFVFHYMIHHSAVYKVVHRFHHYYADPIPIDLFVLHPLETISFGSLWIAMLMLYGFNFYAVLIYLTVNVFFGTTGHLGVEPVPAAIRKLFPFRYLGTPSFHHRHHLDINHNFGFYTNIWDKLFKTYKP
ncbi:sterol desaturase family protein [Mucilaginibacter sp. SJ]|uniref:sterol desaturase family protein n=1 Tax=Mucilaginibacter sp. SJ TaxID=3029053 RepID=UPI0023A981BC|nr:sterol desaturase family protein [Mucilaginibacter sp. SJ]WEA00811.1 sterol desaturase family protein [Mucilaginibacter sp. SJ]